MDKRHGSNATLYQEKDEISHILILESAKAAVAIRMNYQKLTGRLLFLIDISAYRASYIHTITNKNIIFMHFIFEFDFFSPHN